MNYGYIRRWQVEQRPDIRALGSGHGQQTVSIPGACSKHNCLGSEGSSIFDSYQPTLGTPLNFRDAPAQLHVFSKPSGEGQRQLSQACGKGKQTVLGKVRAGG